jgi:DNA-3-methyladenine glycosylase II
MMLKRSVAILQRMSPVEYLARSDKTLAKVIRRVRLPRRKPEPRRLYFCSLAEAIISQQLSVKASDTITKRFIALFGKKPFPTPQEVLHMPTAKIRKTGVSGAKARYIKDLARHVAEKRLDFHKFSKWADEEIITHLTAVHGIGRWTAEMFLMFSLSRPDVFSPGDQGLKNAIRKLYGLKKEPSVKQLKQISDAWKPHRTLACRYLWRSLAPDV